MLTAGADASVSARLESEVGRWYRTPSLDSNLSASRARARCATAVGAETDSSAAAADFIDSDTLHCRVRG